MPARWLMWVAIATSLVLAGCASSDTRNDPAPLTQYTPQVSPAIGWRAPVGSGSSYGFAPAIVGNAVFAASRDGKVARIDAAQGTTVWNSQVAKELSAGVGSDGQTVAVVTPAGEVIALDANGEVKWRARAASEVSVVPWVGDGVVVVRSGDYRVQAFNAANGERIWSVQRPGPALALRAPARMNQIQGLILSGMPGGRLLAIEPGSGAVVWEGIVAVPRGASDLERVNDVVGIPVVRGDVFCAAAYQGRVICFNAKEGGRTVWANNLSSIVGMTADNVRAYVPDNRDRMHAYELEDGDAVWVQDALRNRRVTEPGVVGSWVLVGDLDGYVHALSAQTGELGGRISVGGGAIFAPVQTMTGGALVQAGDSSVVLIQLN
ncbi:outer membrane protein assembly factor BamB [Orrella daihaiensis]|uniref:Outer membrane protein assembly factor BamB n=2 Tax=Orrella daihaiensis TaxID=2782176 RepID=A0ABY4AU46_9BURK|nr:outer membrane protein assembly factor BamB [Orrella daihaiensis]